MPALILRREKLFKAAWKIYLFEYGHDPFEEFRMDWLREEQSNPKYTWELRSQGRYNLMWKEEIEGE